jgi:hypothetical protein
MSKQVYSIENQEKFNVAMVVGHVTSLRGNTQHKEEIADWTYDVELANLALDIYNKVKDKGFSNEEIVSVVNDYFTNPHDVDKLSNAEDDEDYQDFWYGVECGSYFGLPNEESLRKSNTAMELFMNQMKYGFVHEVIEANNLA